ncbi:uncharacterized protein VTP21DRAFT_6719 [Calcarisporiella thermophila]|uniref:uncharacterized protein n=1 Tax=Calcarisporiella thermophila TaxID=911321 RepID=UPI003743810E
MTDLPRLQYHRLPVHFLSTLKPLEANPLPPPPPPEPQLLFPATIPEDESNNLTCNICALTFANAEEQRPHFRSDHHRLNVKRRLTGQLPLTEEEFEEVIEELTESLSGSSSGLEASESEEEEEEEIEKRRGKIEEVIRRAGTQIENDTSEYEKKERSGPLLWFRGEYENETVNLGVYKQVLSEPTLLALQQSQLTHKKQQKPRIWTLLMLSGGHFAGCVAEITAPSTGKGQNEGFRILTHKSFHRYTVRKKQGGSQSTNDSAKGRAKSAGAQIRRHNEAMLRKEVRELLVEWKKLIQESEKIWVHAPGGNNKKTLFGEKGEVGVWLMKKDDERVSGFPFSTRRPTLSELRRNLWELTGCKLVRLTKSDVEGWLAGVGLDNMSELKNAIPPISPPKPEPMPKSKKEKERERGTEEEKEKEDPVITKAIDFARRGKVDLLDSHLRKHELSVHVPLTPHLPDTPTLLHYAAHQGHPQLVEYLLSNGGDPTVLSSATNKTPYEVAKDKETRNIFRRRMAEQPGEWDWAAARVPSALTKEMEEREAAKLRDKRKKEKERKKASKKKEKETEAELASKQEEGGSKKSTVTLGGMGVASSVPSRDDMSLSPEMRMRIERERRARAAEARMAKSAGRGTPGMSVSANNTTTSGPKCDACGEPLEGRVPFERLVYRYCSVSCVAKHRMELEKK